MCTSEHLPSGTKARRASLGALPGLTAGKLGGWGAGSSRYQAYQAEGADRRCEHEAPAEKVCTADIAEF